MNSDIPNSDYNDLNWLKRTAEILDNRFRIPGTQIRFGIDSIVGLIPYVGDVLTFLIGGLLVIVMYRKGASGKLISRMIFNIWIDGVIGTIPLIGDIFDFRYRANLKNVRMMLAYHEKGKYRGSAWGMVLILLFVLFLLVALSLYAMIQILKWISI